MDLRHIALRGTNTIALAWLLASCSDDSSAGAQTNANGRGGETNVTSGSGGKQMAGAGAGGDSTGYGPSCTICQDTKWKVLGRKLMDQ